MDTSRIIQIQDLAGDGRLKELIKLLGTDYTQHDIDLALTNAIAYSQIETAKYLLSKGADLSRWNYKGTYYTAHNNELEGVKFSIANGVDINVDGGMLLSTSVVTAHNEKDASMLAWLLENGANPEMLSTENRKVVKNFETVDTARLIGNP